MCDKFYARCELEYHYNSHLKLTPFKCLSDDCPKEFSNPKQMRRHMKLAHNQIVTPLRGLTSTNVVCSICGEEIEKKDYSEHLRTHRSMRACNYEKCTETFKSDVDLTNHIKEIHDPDYEPSTFTVEALLDETEGNPISKKRFHKCNIENCGAIFANEDFLEQHKLFVHSDNDYHKCRFCSAEFNNKEDYQKHYAEQCSLKNVECHLCGKILTRSSFRYHLEVHTGIKSFICPVELCGKAFGRKDKLKEHEKVHEKANIMSCSLCNENFRIKRKLEEHMEKVHSSG